MTRPYPRQAACRRRRPMRDDLGTVASGAWQAAEKGSFASLVPAAARSPYRQYASGAALGTPSGAALGTPSGAALGTPSGAALGTPSGAALGTPSGAALDAPSGAALGRRLASEPFRAACGFFPTS